jgi:hypothetical protein
VDGIVKGSSPIKSIMITRTISSKSILERIQRELIRFEDELKAYSGLLDEKSGFQVRIVLRGNE